MTLILPWNDQPGEPENVTHVMENDQAIRDYINSGLAADDLASALATLLGITADGVTRRGYGEVLTSQSTAAVGPVDLATVGPQVTLTVPTNGLVLVRMEAEIQSGNAGQQASAWLTEGGVAIGGARIYNDTTSKRLRVLGGDQVIPPEPAAPFFAFTATGGAHTYKMMYGTTGGFSASFEDRKLWAMAVGF